MGWAVSMWAGPAGRVRAGPEPGWLPWQGGASELGPGWGGTGVLAGVLVGGPGTLGGDAGGGTNLWGGDKGRNGGGEMPGEMGAGLEHCRGRRGWSLDCGRENRVRAKTERGAVKEGGGASGGRARVFQRSGSSLCGVSRGRVHES